MHQTTHMSHSYALPDLPYAQMYLGNNITYYHILNMNRTSTTISAVGLDWTGLDVIAVVITASAQHSNPTIQQ